MYIPITVPRTIVDPGWPAAATDHPDADRIALETEKRGERDIPIGADYEKGASMPEIYIPITVQRTIADIPIGASAENPLVAAMRAIGRYEADHEEGGRYHFGGTTIEVTHTRGGDGMNVREWLAITHPDILSEYDERF